MGPPIELFGFHLRLVLMARAVRGNMRRSNSRQGQSMQHWCLRICHWGLLAHRPWATRPTGSQEGYQHQRCFQRAPLGLSGVPAGRAITMQGSHSPLSRHDLRIVGIRIAKVKKECAQGEAKRMRGQGEILSENLQNRTKEWQR